MLDGSSTKQQRRLIFSVNISLTSVTRGVLQYLRIFEDGVHIRLLAQSTHSKQRIVVWTCHVVQVPAHQCIYCRIVLSFSKLSQMFLGIFYLFRMFVYCENKRFTRWSDRCLGQYNTTAAEVMSTSVTSAVLLFWPKYRLARPEKQLFALSIKMSSGSKYPKIIC